MRVYVAGSSADIDRARRAAANLERSGVEVTSTWWVQVEEHGEGNPTDDAVRASCARRDLAELDAADVVWLLVPEVGHSHGAFFEFGRAAARDVLVVASGATRRSIFCSLAVECETDAIALEALLVLSRQDAARSAS